LGEVHPKGAEGVLGRIPLTVMFTLERIDPPRHKWPSPPKGGIYPLSVIREVLFLKNFKDCISRPTAWFFVKPTVKFCFSKTSRTVFKVHAAKSKKSSVNLYL